MENIFDKIQEVQNGWAEVIAKEVSERRFYDVAEVTAYANTRLRMAISEMAKLQVSSFEDEMTKLKEIAYGSGYSSQEKGRALGKLAIISPKKKQLNRLVHTMRNQDEYRDLQKFVTERYGKEVLHEFFNTQSR